LAPTAPSKAGKPKDAADAIGTRAFAGDTTTMSNGIVAPTENVAAEVRGEQDAEAVERFAAANGAKPDDMILHGSS
jgi:hypothetical protein